MEMTDTRNHSYTYLSWFCNGCRQGGKRQIRWVCEDCTTDYCSKCKPHKKIERVDWSAAICSRANDVAELLTWPDPFEFTNDVGDEVRIDASGETFVSEEKKGRFDGFDPASRRYYVGSGLSRYYASLVPAVVLEVPRRCPPDLKDEATRDIAALREWLKGKQENANTVPMKKVDALRQWLQQQWSGESGSMAEEPDLVAQKSDSMQQDPRTWFRHEASQTQIFVLGGTGSSEGMDQLMSVECLGDHHPRNWVKCSAALSDTRQCAPIGKSQTSVCKCIILTHLMLTLSNNAYPPFHKFVRVADTTKEMDQPWKEGAEMPISRFGACCAPTATGEDVYVVGGWDGKQHSCSVQVWICSCTHHTIPVQYQAEHALLYYENR